MSYAEVAAMKPARRRRVRLPPRRLRRPRRLPLHLDLGHHRQARVHRHHRRRPHARARNFSALQLLLAASLRAPALEPGLSPSPPPGSSPWLNIVSTRESANVQTALTWLKVLMIVVIAGFCFASIRTRLAGTTSRPVFIGARGGFTGFMIALIAALWAYDGWSDVSQMAGEVHEPAALHAARARRRRRHRRRALHAHQRGDPVHPSRRSHRTAPTVPPPTRCALIAGHFGAALVSIGMAVSICATFVGSSLSGARVPFAAARDRLFPRSLAAIHPRFHTPSSSLILQAVLSSLLLLAIGKFQALFSLAIFSEWLFYALTASTVFVFRHREPDTPRPYSVTGYPVVPASSSSPRS